MSDGSPFAGQINAYQTAAQKGDANSIKALYDGADAVALFTEGTSDITPSNYSAIINGADAIANDLAAHFKSGPNGSNPYAQLTLTEVGYSVEGTRGWSYGTWYADPNAKTAPNGSGSWSACWVQKSGSWLIQVHSVVPYISGT